jgi:hypothetical protein
MPKATKTVTQPEVAIDDQMPDADLSAIFAVEVAGWRRKPVRAGSRVFEFWINANGEEVGPLNGHEFSSPVFAASSDAVLPFLESIAAFPEVRRPISWDFIRSCVHDKETRLEDATIADREWEVTINPRWDSMHPSAGGRSKSLARAACIALIRYKRAMLAARKGGVK